eukprot:1141017-Pelagomonas_calceolata.AAC.10
MSLWAGRHTQSAACSRGFDGVMTWVQASLRCTGAGWLVQFPVCALEEAKVVRQSGCKCLGARPGAPIKIVSELTHKPQSKAP